MCFSIFIAYDIHVIYINIFFLQAGLRSDTLHIPHKLHNLICGRKRCYLQAIMEETSINIYFPSPFADMSKTDHPVKNQNTAKLLDIKEAPPIYLTGDPIGIGRAKEMLTKLSVQKVRL